MKRLLSMLVVIAMVVSLIPNVFAAKEEVDFDELTGRLVVLEDISSFEVNLAEGSDGMIYQWTPYANVEMTLTWTAPEGTDISVVVTQGETTTAAVSGEAIIVYGEQLVEIEVSEAAAQAAEFVITGECGYVEGTEDAPIMLWDNVNEVVAEGTVFTGNTTWYQTRHNGPVIIEGTGAFNVIYNGETFAAVDGKVEIEVTAQMFAPAVFAIDTVGAYTISLIVPVGAQDNPAELIIGENTVEFAEGAGEYFYNWTAEEEGKLVITMPEGNWQYTLSNMTTCVYGEIQWSDSDPVVNPAEIAVAAGDVIELKVLTYDPANPWTAPAGSITFTADFELPEPPAPALVITKQPENILAFNNDAVTLSVEAEGEDLKYHWYRMEPGASTWTAFNIAANASAGTANFAFTAFTGNHGRQYKCVITDAAGNTVETEPVSLTIRHITSQPTSQYVTNINDVAKFTVGYSVSEGVTYQWQLKYSTEPDSRWRNTSASGNTTNTLSFTANANTVKDRYQFRCVINDNGTQIITNVAQLWFTAEKATIKSATTGTLNLVEGYYAFLSVEAEGIGVQYYWQACTDGSTWYNCSSSTSAREATFRVLAYPYRQGYQYRCMILTPNGAGYNQVFTEPVTFNILPAANITEQPANVEGNLGENVTFSVKVQATEGLVMEGPQQVGDNSTFTYKWQKSKNGSTWNYLNSYEGALTDTLTVPVTEANDGCYFRCVVFNDSGYGMGYVFSAPAQLTIAE